MSRNGKIAMRSSNLGTDLIAIGFPFSDVAHRFRGQDLANAMTVDVEDYFHVSAFEDHISRSDWSSLPSRLARNIDRILELFDAKRVKATFFTLGWVCQRHARIIRQIANAGHEIASHGKNHVRVGVLTRQQFEKDVQDTRRMLEDTSGQRVRGYRAPSFSLGHETLWAHEALATSGYEYSSSVFPIRHDHYGIPDAPRFPFLAGSDAILEVPMSTVRVFGRNWPCAGGGYFRLLPLSYSRWALQRVNQVEKMPAVFYFHPWELDPGQPRVTGLSFKTHFRHYVNLGRFEQRLSRMLTDFRWGRMDEIFCDLSQR